MSSKVTDNSGKIIEVADLGVPAERVYSFVERNRKTYFEDHSLDWALDEIITRGMAEITRQIKTTAKRAEDNAAGTLLRQFNMSPAEAAKLILKLQADAAAAAKMQATK